MPEHEVASRRVRTMPPSQRVFAAVLGAVFVFLAVVIVVISAPLTWRPMLGALVVAALGADFLVAAWRDRRPWLAGMLFLP